ncbi:MAG: 16S rRNA (guanine(527)-N(7))-methyltransferase RsmG [Desulfobulbaceae bacterium]|nr:16S rRNA (guanine(527)-N(7))-methyltransferase RsmG [Desulfobulbaceae bacterium]HIJ78308.1 16S rRNA (guanine(527)-N(7))-methyltransferase RsmG [Deltaproteobacteria bacterium]
MTLNEKTKLLNQGLAILNLDLGPTAIDQLGVYCDELIKWNRKINLVGKAELKELIETHFLDSLTLLPLITASPLADIGTGAGFPGLVLKIARPELAVILVEPRQKRVSFLNHIIRTLGLKEIEVRCGRLEKDSNLVAGKELSAPLITSRAFTSVADFLALADPINPPGGKILCMKGPRAEEEIKQWQEEQPISPYRLSQTISTALPFSGNSRNLLIFTKQDD